MNEINLQELIDVFDKVKHAGRLSSAIRPEHAAILALAAHVRAQEGKVREKLVSALLGVGKSRQFTTPCFCSTASNLYCVAQPQCVAANKALAQEKNIVKPQAEAQG